MAVGLQLLAFVWKLFFDVLAAAWVTSGGLSPSAEHEQVLLETRLLERRAKLVNIVAERQIVQV